MTPATDHELGALVRLSLEAIAKAPPSPLVDAMRFIANTHRLRVPKNPVAALVNHLEKCGPNDAALDSLALALHGWDHRDGSWANGDPAHSEARRRRILFSLGFSATQQVIVNRRIPRVADLDLPIVVAEEHQQWYDEHGRQRGAFYWDHYVRQLLPPTGRWHQRDVELLELSVEDVIARLSDPCRAELYPVKGLVMGYVQSGKTSHFNGLIAKAVDAGYRLIVVLAGTLDILRRQTQRRIDRDLVGRELLTVEEYGSDAEWPVFVSHGARPSLMGACDWERLTNRDDDYESLKRRLSLLEFKVADRTKPFHHWDNLRKAPARLIVIKKTPGRLKQDCDDLEGLRALRNRLEHVPTLVIDDESDQASINTLNQGKPEHKGKRTATNGGIGRLLSLLPRAQYVGYTATPFANVFIDPDDANDLFPKDFIISLRRPDGYMGVSDFYDLHGDHPVGDYSGNRNAFVREVEGANDAPKNLPRAIDAFVLSGALKLFRQHVDPDAYRFRHHTMLVHHAATQVVHDADKAVVARIFRDGARYQARRGMEDLEKLYVADFQPVSRARAPGAPMPKSFKALKPFIAQCVKKICADQAVRVVNGDERHRDDTPDFDAAPVWAILVGGTKLSRGYTVEGLTVSYYRRPTGAGDTLMQMGRWFGFRPGYGDLVRLFIGRNETRRKSVVDLYEAFGAVCRDEEALREDLRKYAAEGLRPWQVPPLVKQHLAELPPTSRNKMFNAEIKSLDYAGHWTEKTSAPAAASDAKANLRAVATLMGGSLFKPRAKFLFQNAKGAKREFDALAGTVEGSCVLQFLREYRWFAGRKPIALETEYISKSIAAGQLGTWTVMLPQLAAAGAQKSIFPKHEPLSVISRTRVSESRFGVYSDPGHVEAAKAIAGVEKVLNPNRALSRFIGSATPVLVLYFVAEKGKSPAGLVSVGFGIQYPGVRQAAGIHWGARRGDQLGQPVVSSSEITRRGRRGS